MTDADLVLKKLAYMETCIRELRELARPELILTDLREQRFVEHTLQLAIQAALDVASHVVSSDRLGEPETSFKSRGAERPSPAPLPRAPLPRHS